MKTTKKTAGSLKQRFTGWLMTRGAALLAPILGALFYVGIVLILLLLIVCLILLFVNVSPEKMLLPPFLHVEKSGSTVLSYVLSFGNGIKMEIPGSDVTLGMLKTAFYAWMGVALCTCLTLSALFRFLSRLLKKVSEGDLLSPLCGRYTEYMGLTFLIGGTVRMLALRLFNYTLVKTFLAGGRPMSFVMGLDLMAVVAGLLLLLLGAVYHRAGLQAAASSTAVADPE